VAPQRPLKAAYADPDTIFVGLHQKRVISSFLQPQVRVGREESIFGSIVGEYLSDTGVITVVLDRHLKPSDAVITTREYLGVGPLSGNNNSRAMFVEELPKDGDYERSMITGEYTIGFLYIEKIIYVRTQNK